MRCIGLGATLGAPTLAHERAAHRIGGYDVRATADPAALVIEAIVLQRGAPGMVKKRTGAKDPPPSVESPCEFDAPTADGLRPGARMDRHAGLDAG